MGTIFSRVKLSGKHVAALLALMLLSAVTAMLPNLILPVRSLSADWGDLTTERKPVHLQPQAVWYPQKRHHQRRRNLLVRHSSNGQIWAARERLVLWILLWLSWPTQDSQAKWIPPMWQKISVRPRTSANPPSIAAFPE